MSASCVLEFRSEIRSAETPKDFSRWHSKREVLHDLYILKGKGLSDVKIIMESDHGFPKTLKLSEYEYVLREEFKYRKNLSAHDWRHSIAPRIARRNAEGKRSEVLLNGSKVQNVERRIERSFKSKRSHRHAKAHTAELPYGLIIRTPSPEPSTRATCLNFSRDFGETQIEDAKREQSPIDSTTYSPAATYWLSLLTDTIPVLESGSGATIVLSAHLLRDGCPINKFLNLLDEYQRQFNQADLKLFGPSPTISQLGKICFDFSNQLQGETISKREMRLILDWIGFSVDIAILRTFFSQKALTILAVWEALVSEVQLWRHSAALDVLLSVHLSIRDAAPWTLRKPFYCLSECLRLASTRVATVISAYSCNQRELDSALEVTVSGTLASGTGSIEVVKQLINAGASLKNEYCQKSADQLVRYFASRECERVDLALLKVLLEVGVVVDEPSPHDHIMDWSGPRSPICSTDYLLLDRGNFANNEGLWSLVSLYSDRQQTTVTVPGIFEAARGGQEQLCSYFNARSKPYDNHDRNRVLEIALSEASGKGYANVVQSLVQFGVDPNVRMLPRFTPTSKFQNTWHPVIRAVNTGQLHTLRILVTESSTDIVFEDTVDQQLGFCSLRNMEDSQRGQILRVLSALDLSTACRRRILLRAIAHDCWRHRHEGPDYAFASQLLDLGLACLDRRQYLEGKASNILVRAIRAGCDVRALDYLVQRGVGVLSGLSAGTIRALWEATILQSDCERYETLGFLAQNVEGFRSHAQENGSSLLLCLLKHMHCTPEWSVRKDHWNCGCESMITLKWFLDLGTPLEASILAGLIEHTDDHFMLAMIHSVPDVSTIDGFNALQQSICHGRLNLAVALVERGAQVNHTRGLFRCTALQQACKYGAPLWFIKFLVDKGVDVNAPPDPDDGSTALQIACAHGAQLSCISFLIDKGADVNAPPDPWDGFTALQYAASKGLMNVAGLLLDRGADVNSISGAIYHSPNFRFMRAIDVAAMYCRLDMAYFLIAAGARSCRPGCTGLEGAIEIASGSFAVASLLQEYADSRSGDPREAERMWLQANHHACMFNRNIQGAKWVAFAKRAGGESKANFWKYVDEHFDSLCHK